MPRLVLASALACLLLLTGPVGAQFTFHTGNIVVYHLNSQVPNRGPCVQTLPAAPTTWICLSKTDPLYQEIRALLRDANELGRECAFGWTSTDANGFAVLTLLQCF